MLISVIVSTYNNAAALQKSFWGWQRQLDNEFEILIADDGSAEETRLVVEDFKANAPCNVMHVWHADDGFRKSKILNQAIQVANGDYLIFTDGDCIPRDDFVGSHRRCSRPNYFLSGGSHVDVPASIHRGLKQHDVESGIAFDAPWLMAQGMPRRYRWRLTRNRQTACLLDLLTPRPGVFTGANASAWKHDVLAVNGFDASSTYGSDDKEFGARLTNNGVRSRQLKHSLICLHQSHSRPYSLEQIRLNKLKLQDTKKRRVTWIEDGIERVQPVGRSIDRRVA